ncbi:N-formylglutamate amidohydrolase [Magnetospira thiophila]
MNDALRNPSPYPDALDRLGPGDPPLFHVVNPKGRAPLLLVSDHNSNAIPAAFGQLGLSPTDLQRHIAYDIGADGVARGLAERLDAVAVLAGYSRLLIDNNRPFGDPTCIPEISDRTPIPGNQGLSESDMLRRAETFYHPYHHAIANAVAHLWRSTEQPPALLSIHTFTPSLNGQDRYWHIGVLWNRDPRLAMPLIAALRQESGLHVGDNEPYSGTESAYTIDLHAGSAGLPNVAVEIRQDLVETAEGAARWADRLATALGPILARDGLHRVEHF